MELEEQGNNFFLVLCAQYKVTHLIHLKEFITEFKF